jgi:hypothetical protein
MNAIKLYLAFMLTLLIAINITTIICDQQGLQPNFLVIILLDIIMFPMIILGDKFTQE